MLKNIFNKVGAQFFDLKAPIYKNKKTGQISLVLPRKELKKFIEMNGKDNKMKIPKTMPIRIFTWEK